MKLLDKGRYISLDETDYFTHINLVEVVHPMC